MALKGDLERLVGAGRVSDDPEVLSRYSKDHSFLAPRTPGCVVYAESTEDVQSVVGYANQHVVPVTPRSSGVGFYGSGVPVEGGIVLDLSRMDRVLEVSSRHKKVKVQAGVTWMHIQQELANHGMMVCGPLLPHLAKSVLTSSLEREPLLNPRWECSETFLTGEVVLPEGDAIRLGTAAQERTKGGHFPDGSFPNRRIFMAAQGTFGVVVWAYLKAELMPRMDRLFLIPIERLEDACELIYRTQHRLIGNECFVLNRFNLAAVLADDHSGTFRDLRTVIPSYVVVLCLSGGLRLPVEKIAYEEEALGEVLSSLGLEAGTGLAGIPSAAGRLLELLRRPWYGDPYWKLRYKGGCHEVFFYTTVDRVPRFTQSMVEIASKHGYPPADIGFYLQPVERGLAAFCQYGFHCSPDTAEVTRVRDLYFEASEVAIGMGGLFTTPYGPWAEMAYRRAPEYADMLRTVKSCFDPNNIMNPGRLCF